ncbi:CocE/NonD family hydrolase [Agromyces seonyuensis]|uniref:CocE/NonD family hydrolase n=1 Tax=Agromyces seonyuensis TaxID=2662446 RepID=UPI0019224452|nr:CocE/NonD family hydrolase [Agromyces seonyuensis]
MTQPSIAGPRSRQRPAVRRLAASGLAVALAAGLLGFGAAPAQAAPEIELEGGVTAPAFEYADAIRERVYIPVPGVDQDRDGVDDVTAVEIIRPRVEDPSRTVPAIIDPSPYYTTVGRGNESQLIVDVDGDGINDEWPLFYDNYFVERGYAVILAEMDGTGNSTGCPLHGGAGDIASMKVVVDWLNGRAAGRTADGAPALADWHNGKSAMIGKSYDGTLANGVAATGVEGLETIVPISAISEWYRYSRTGGIRHNTDYASGLSNNVTNPDRRAICAPTRTDMNAMDGDEHGDVNAFWAERDYTGPQSQITASVFLVHGFNDDNVRMSQVGSYWDDLVARDVPRKIWLAKVGHIDPFDFRREVWVDTLHRWFDQWLYGIDNGIMSEPQATIETEPGVYEDVESWPVPGSEDVSLALTGADAATAGQLRFEPVEGAAARTVTTGASSAHSETNLIADPTGIRAQRTVFLSEPLTADLRISGTPRIELDASISGTQSNLSAILVDYGPTTRTPRSPGDGVVNTAERTCWGGQSAADDACYLEVERRTTTADLWRVSRGVLDSSNRESVLAEAASPVVAGQQYGFDWALEPYDEVFEAGHRIGVVVSTNLSGFVAGAPATVTVDAATSRIVLPVVGGLPAAFASGGLGAPAPVSLAFDLGGRGSAIEPQAVAYGSAPVAPATPVDATGWEVFGGWYADADRSTPFDFAAPLAADATAYAKWVPADSAAPGKATLSNTSGRAHGLHDGTYDVVADLWWGTPGRELRLYENGVLVTTKALVPSGTSQQASVRFSGKPNGTYVYRAELVNSRGATSTTTTTVTVSDAAPGTPVVSHDNWDRDGSFTATANLWWGTNATSYRFEFDGEVVGSGPLVAASPAAQAATLRMTGVPVGSHTLVAVFVNAAGETSSRAVTVRVD